MTVYHKNLISSPCFQTKRRQDVLRRLSERPTPPPFDYSYSQMLSHSGNTWLFEKHIKNEWLALDTDDIAIIKAVLA